MAFQETTGDFLLWSPGQRRCVTVEGDARAIIDAGMRYSRLGQLMENAARELDKIADGDESYRALALDEIRESARTAARDLEKVARRYTTSDGSVGTGRALLNYGQALATVQGIVTADLVASISTADTVRNQASARLDDARGEVKDLETTRFWEDEATDAEKQQADAEFDAADDALDDAEEELTALWSTFDGAVSVWEEAYDTAVSRIKTAITVSDVNDSRWDDLLDGLADLAGFVGLVLTVAAIIVGAPWMIAAAAIAGLIVLAAQLVLYMKGSGRVSKMDLALSTLAVIPFGKAFAGAVRAGSGTGAATRAALGLGGDSASAIASGRNAMTLDLRMWPSRASTAAAAGNRASRSATAGALADDFIESAGAQGLPRMWAAIRSGGSATDAQLLRLTSGIRNGSWAAGGEAGQRSLSWAASNATGRGDQVLNVFNAGVSAYQAPETVSSMAGNAGRLD